MARRGTVSLTDSQRQELEHHRDHHARPYVRERCAALVKIAHNHTPQQVAQQGLLKRRDPDTVYAWLTAYATAGCAGLLAHQHAGPRRGRL
jgi:hypothetical protein